MKEIYNLEKKNLNVTVTNLASSQKQVQFEFISSHEHGKGTGLKETNLQISRFKMKRPLAAVKSVTFPVLVLFSLASLSLVTMLKLGELMKSTYRM